MSYPVKKLVSTLADSYEAKIVEIIDSCDSPIEKGILIYLIKNLYHKYNGMFSYTFGLEYRGICEDSKILESASNYKLKKFKYNRKSLVGDVSLMYRFNSMILNNINASGNSMFEVLNNKIELNEFNQPIRKDLIIEPQKIVIDHEKECYYFVDIAVYERILLKNDNEVLIRKKIAIECDGHEYHSSKDQIKSDNKRSRRLALLGWQVLRYSGSEIYGDSKKDMKNIFNELLRFLKL